MNIPDKAVEAAALALDEYWGGRYAPNAVEELSDEMRVVLEAASPFIAAQALRDALAGLPDEVEKWKTEARRMAQESRANRRHVDQLQSEVLALESGLQDANRSGDPQ